MAEPDPFADVMVDRLTGTAKGETMYVLGNGPSMEDFPADLLLKHKSIGVNRVLRPPVVRRPSYILFLDSMVWKHESVRMLESQIPLLVGWPLVKRIRAELPAGRFLVFDYAPQAEPGRKDGKLHQANLSGYYAASIAARMVEPGGRVIIAGHALTYDVPALLKRLKASQEVIELYQKRDTHTFKDSRREGCNDRSFPNAVRCFEVLRSTLEGRVEFAVQGPSRLLEVGFPSV